jgi:hypothetical protein
MDNKGGVIGKRIEKYDKSLNAWFEVEKSGPGWKLTAKGKMDKGFRDEECTGNCAADDCP